MCSSNTLGQITHVLFDMDGLLLDTESLYTIAQVKLLEPYGMVFTPEVKAKMMGRKDLEAAQVMIEHYGLEGKMDPVEFIKNRNEILQEMFPKCELMPGAERLLYHLSTFGIPMALATASHRYHYDLKTTEKHKELFDKVFTHIITGDEVTVAKPEPEIFELAASKFSSDIRPEQVLVFEDAPLGVEAALRANMKCVWVTHSDQDDNPVAHQKLESLLDFKPETWGLPKFV